MIRAVLAAAIFAAAPVLASAQSAAAPLIITATVVSTCRVDVPLSTPASNLATFPVTLTCARRGTTPHLQRPVAPRRSDVHDAVLIIEF